MRGMRILILLVQYHPAANPNVFRWSAIAEHWAQQGHEVHVLCSRRRGRPAEELDKGVYVHRAGHGTLLDWAYNLLALEGRRGEAGGQNPIGGPSLWRRLMEKVVDYTWRKLYWPDGSCLWYFPALKKARKLIRRRSIEAVISVSYPFTAHLIGLACKKHFPGLIWLADTEDPFSILEAQPQNNFTLYRTLNYRAEQEVFRAAGGLSVTVEAARQAYQAAFGPLPRMFVVPPLFDQHTWALSGEISWKAEGQFLNIGYFGAFYTNIREPDELLHLLWQAIRKTPALAGKIRVHFFGEIAGAFLPAFYRYKGLEKIICMHGLVSKVVAMAAMRNMDVLLNIGNKSSIQLPSKCVDYLATGKPILNLHYGAADTFKHFFEDYPNIRNIDVSAAGADVAFHGHLDALAQENPGFVSLSLEQVRQMLEPYTIGPIAGRFLELLKRP